LASLHFVLGGLTRPLLYLLAVAQAAIVPVLVALDPDVSFGSETYSLGAGIAIAFIATVEMVFLLGTAVGLLAALAYIGHRERTAASARLAAIWQEANAPQGGSDLGRSP
jgi:hypothetical protein